MKRCVSLCVFLFAALVLVIAQDKPDALKLYRNARDLEAAGRGADASAMYLESIEVCKLDLQANPKNMDAYTIYGWALNRLQKYQDAVNLCLEALKITSDYRITETLAESYFYLGNYKDSLRHMEKYIDAAPKGERISTAYFFVAEIYRLTRMFNKAEIAYTAAVFLEPGLSLWWYRLGTVRETLGEKQPAMQAYERALKLRPEYKEASDGLNRVRS
ncbi:MAG TPA: tetratricopeptide repeat protein [Treponemataceae bacterium]|nr:MAG: tetratricopeptide repeat protein [Treponema sp.]HOC28645.1 tetratricopeptide repeat protein [Treponemataceae bacterium]HPX48083.1 tetratricopeptide repeat protein [Treponemataceae bacterium]HQL32920.1 tetratricopeptide repeat protein [Treponemataceae bacterium]